MNRRILKLKLKELNDKFDEKYSLLQVESDHDEILKIPNELHQILIDINQYHIDLIDCEMKNTGWLICTAIISVLLIYIMYGVVV